MKQEILISKKNKIFIPAYISLFADDPKEFSVEAMQFNAELMRLGYMLDSKTLFLLSGINDISGIYSEVLEALNRMKGSHVKHKPMYKNFPSEVFEKSYYELLFNAIMHYFTYGHWSPESVEELRPKKIELGRMVELSFGDEDDMLDTFKNLVETKSPLSGSDEEYLAYLLRYEYYDRDYPYNITFKEVTGLVCAESLRNRHSIRPFVSTPTDVLRAVVAYCGGDVSLATLTKFKSLPRPLRRIIVLNLHWVVNPSNYEDFNYHTEMWKKLFHSLHVGEYKARNVNHVANVIRNGGKFESFNSKVEKFLNLNDFDQLLPLLQTRPTVFARRLDHLLRKYPNNNGVVLDRFREVADKVSSRVLWQLRGHMKKRNPDHMLVAPKGNERKMIKLERSGGELSMAVRKSVVKIINTALISRYSTDSEKMGKVWIDPRLKDCTIPMSERMASKSLRTVSRGTKLPFSLDEQDEEKNILRLFIYWQGVDVDLSALFLDNNLENTGYVDYTNLRIGNSENRVAVHSGDIVNAPNGASEFIDIDIELAKRSGARYVLMGVFSFSPIPFDEMDICFAGWMMRDDMKSNEIYEPKTVSQKVDLASHSRTSTVAMFDLKERKVIWLDLDKDLESRARTINSVAFNLVGLIDMVRMYKDLSNGNNLYDLFSLHAKAEGNSVTRKKENANITIGLEDCDITPWDMNTINSQFL